MAGYQVMPRLSPERYAALEADIIANGVQEPIKVSEAGVIVDGHHRDEIARKHDLHCPRVVVKGDDAYLRDRAYTWNGARRDLTAEERRAVVEKSLRSDPILRDSEHARRTGADPRTVKRVRAAEGVPTPDDVIREYAEAHPEKSNREIAADLGAGREAVAAVRGGRKHANVENLPPESEPAPVMGTDGKAYPASQPVRPEPEPETPPEPEGTPEPTAASASMAPGFEPGDLEELNNPRPSETHQPRAEAITSQFTSAISDLTRVANRFRRIADDKNFPRNKEKVAAMYRHDLNRLIGELQTIADEIN